MHACFIRMKQKLHLSITLSQVIHTDKFSQPKGLWKGVSFTLLEKYKRTYYGFLYYRYNFYKFIFSERKELINDKIKSLLQVVDIVFVTNITFLNGRSRANTLQERSKSGIILDSFKFIILQSKLVKTQHTHDKRSNSDISQRKLFAKEIGSSRGLLS